MTKMVSRNEQEYLVNIPYLGMNTKEAPQRLPDAMGTDLYNVDLNEVQGITKRSGFVQFNTGTQIIPKFNTGTIQQITGVMVYGSSVTWTGSAGEVFYMPGNSSYVFWPIDNYVGTATLSLATAYSQTVTAGSYVIAPARVNSMYDFTYSTTQKLMVFGGNDGYYSSAGSTGSFTRLNALLTNDADVSAVVYQDKIFFCNGYQLKYWDGSNLSSMSGSPDISDPKFIALYTIGNANYLCALGSNTSGKQSEFIFSDVNAPTTWPAANLYYAGQGDGTQITGGIQTPNGFAIFKSSSIFMFNGIPGSGQLTKVVSDTGCVASKTIKFDRGYIYFLGRRGGTLGLFKFDGSQNVLEMTWDIEPTLTALTQNKIQNACGEIYDDYYILSFPDDKQHFKIYIGREFRKGDNDYFPIVRGNRYVSSILKQVVNGTSYLFSGSPVNGFVYRELSGTSDNTVDNLYVTSSAINSYAETGWIDMGDNTKRKEILRSYIEATASGNWNLNLYVYKDFQTTGYNSYSINLNSTLLTWAQVVFLVTPWQTGIDKLVTELLFSYPSFARYFKFRWINSNSGEPFVIYPMNIFFKKENR